MVGKYLKKRELSFWGILVIIFVFLAPLEPFFIGQIGSALKFYAVGCIGLFIIKLLYRRRVVIYTPAQIILLLFLAIIFLSAFWSAHIARGFDIALSIGLQVIFILLATQINYSNKEKNLILIGYIIGCLILSGFVLVNIDQISGGGGRVSVATASEALDPNNVSAYLVSAVAILQKYRFLNRFLERIKLFCTVIFIIATLMTASRGAAIALLIFVLYNAMSQSNLKSTIKNILVIAIITIIVIQFSNYIFENNNPIDFLIYRFTSDSSGGSYRLLLWNNAIKAIGRRPIWGYGLGSSPYIVSWGTLGPHNTYLTIWLESGSIALGLLLAFYILFWKYKRQENFDMAVFGMLIITSVTSFFFDTYNKKIFWIPILLCMVSLTSRKEDSNLKR